MLTCLLERVTGGRRKDRSRRLAGEVMRVLEESGLLVVDRDLLRLLKTTRKALFQTLYELVLRESMYMMSDAEGKVILMTNAEYTRFMTRRSTTRETEIRRRDGSHIAAEAGNNAMRPETLPSREHIGNEAEQPALVASVAADAQKDLREILCADPETSLFTGATLGGTPRDGVIAISSEVSEGGGEASFDVLFPPHLMQGEAEPAELVRHEWFALDIDKRGDSGENRDILPGKRQTLPERRRESRLVAEGVGADGK